MALPEIIAKKKRGKPTVNTELQDPVYKTMFQRNQEPAIQLPISIVPDPPYLVYIKKCAALCAAASKKSAIATLQGQEINLDDQVESILLLVWNNGFNEGLSKMDKMHQAANNSN